MNDAAAEDLRKRRIERCESWIKQARKSKGNKDVSFIFWWIAFNTLYDYEDENFEREKQRKLQQAFFRKIIDCDTDERIYHAVQTGFDDVIKKLIQNKYLFEPYWEHRNGNPVFSNWSKKFARSKRQFGIAADYQDTAEMLYHTFDRLYTLRNQLVHGGATLKSKRNRVSIEGGWGVMSHLVPVFLGIIKSNPDIKLGKPYYYVNGD